MALYNKYRPTSFDLICGQEQTKKILANQINTKSLSHTYLFTGPAGTGKTTMARILASMINCSTGMTVSPDPKDPNVIRIMSGKSSMDVLEIDAATDGGIDDIRDLREHALYAPGEMAYKIWIVDECHQLTTAAWQGLLKILEEPPAHVIFILCTTESSKIPETILTRALAFRFLPLTSNDITAYLKKIAVAEKIDIGDESLKMVAKSSRGSMRQALSSLDKLMAMGNTISTKDVASILGVPSRKLAKEYLISALYGRFLQGLEASSEVIGSGVTPADFFSEVAIYIHDVLFCNMPDYNLEDHGYSPEEIEDLKKTLDSFISNMEKFSVSPTLIRCCRILDVSSKMSVYNVQPQYQADMAWAEMRSELKKNLIKK